MNKRAMHQSDSDRSASSDSEPNTIYEPLPCVEKDLPSLATFRKARKLGMGAHVERRKHHHHARCTKCKELSEQRQQGFKMRVGVEQWDQEMFAHNDETRFWRDLERKYIFASRYNPGRVLVITFDDTSIFSLLRFTNRPPQNFPNSTVNCVPFNITNHGNMENFYIDSEKSVHKGGNRICTYLYNMLHRIKHRKSAKGSVDSMQAKARKLVLMGDNFIENKCNVLLAFCSHLIHFGWFDEIELLYGPVGHTHGGNDTNHGVHNNVCANFNSNLTRISEHVYTRMDESNCQTSTI